MHLEFVPGVQTANPFVEVCCKTSGKEMRRNVRKVVAAALPEHRFAREINDLGTEFAIWRRGDAKIRFYGGGWRNILVIHV